jgi:DNA-directed RNA polymerase subunit L
MDPCPGLADQYTVRDPAFDQAYGELLCRRLRRDPRVTHASHATDYTGLRLKIETRQGVEAQDVFRDAAAHIADKVQAILKDLEGGV